MAPQLGQLSAKLGRPLDPEQHEAIDVLTGLRADGRPASLEAAIVCPRQNMKTWAFQLIALGRLLQPGGDKLIVWSAHEVATSQATFLDFQELIETHPWLSTRVTKVSQANGKEGIQFAGGRWLRFRARIRTGGRGLSGDCVVLDEAFALIAAHMGALLPILSTRRRAAVFYGSSAGLPESAVLRGVRDRGRLGGSGAPAYIEWCVPGSLRDPGCAAGPKCLHLPGTAGCTLDREDLVLTANPAAYADRRITLDYLRAERLALTPEEYARERFGWWDDPAGESPITVEAWAARAVPADERHLPENRPVPRPVALAVDTTRGLRSATVAAVGRRPDGRLHGELLRMDAGTDWVAAFLRDKQREHGCPVLLLGGSATAQALVPDLERARVRIVEVPTADYAASCVGLAADVEDDRWRHLGDPIVAASVAGAASRDVGDTGAWRWSPKDSTSDITPLVALTLARWGLLTVAKVASRVD
jgi:hypothetical protein